MCIRDRYLRSLQKRREEVFALIQASGKLNEQQLNQVEASSVSYTHLADVYHQAGQTAVQSGD